MTDLVGFLRARLDEDERSEDLWVDIPGPNYTMEKIKGAHVPPSPRMLAEVEAKRRIIDLLVDEMASRWNSLFGKDQYQRDETIAAWALQSSTLRLLALPYADHPDFNPEWKLDDVAKRVGGLIGGDE